MIIFKHIKTILELCSMLRICVSPTVEAPGEGWTAAKTLRTRLRCSRGRAGPFNPEISSSPSTFKISTEDALFFFLDSLGELNVVFLLLTLFPASYTCRPESKFMYPRFTRSTTYKNSSQLSKIFLKKIPRALTILFTSTERRIGCKLLQSLVRAWLWTILSSEPPQSALP